MKRVVAWSLLATLSATAAQSLEHTKSVALAANPTSSPFVGCTDPDIVRRINVGQVTTLQFYGAANPFTPSPSPSGSPTATPLAGQPLLPPGAKLILVVSEKSEKLVQQAGPDGGLLPFGGSTLPVGYKIVDPKNKQYLEATKETGPLSLAQFVPTPKPSTTPSPTPVPTKLPVGVTAPPLPRTANLPSIDDESVLSYDQTPVVLATAAPGARTVIGYIVRGQKPGHTRVLITSGEGQCSYAVFVAPGNAEKKLVFTTGVAESAVGAQSVSSITSPSPLPSGVPGQYVTFSERSSSQTFLPILASYRVTDWSYPWQVYLTGGFAATSTSGKSLFGLSLGMNDQIFVTGGLHSTTVDLLQPGITPNGFTPYATVPAGAPLTFSQRTMRPFLSISFPLCAVTSIFSAIGVGTCTPSPTPAPSPTASPAPTKTG